MSDNAKTARGTKNTLRAADLFAGAGGASTGLALAATAANIDLDLVAVNHWPAAVQTHAANHPYARHLCEAIERVDPRDAVPGGRLDLLVAGPECTFFSSARGGRPIDDQRRSSAWSILRWLELLRVQHVLIENVPEFQGWAPLDGRGRPLKSKHGEVYRAFLAAIEAMNYKIDARVLNAADHGEATTRRRLFIQATRGRRPIMWPEPTHSRRGERTLLRSTRPWRPAREIIDWTLPAKSIFTRKRPLSSNTMRRIEAGLRRFGGRPFVLGQQGGGAPRLIEDPLPTITSDGAISVIQPFIVEYHGDRDSPPRVRALDGPLPTQTTENRFGLVEAPRDVEPFTMPYYSNGDQLARPVSQPVATITTRDRFALVIPVGIDVRFRMLQPSELAAAMGFPKDYRFVGTKTDAVRMIGNAWSCRIARALCACILESLTRKPELRERIA